MYTRKDYFINVCGSLGIPTNDFRLYFLIAWSTFETGNTITPTYNLLATTLKTTTSTDFNLSGVQNYGSMQEGVNSTVETLQGYHNILNALHTTPLRKNFVNAGIDDDLSKWGTGRKSNDIVSVALNMEGGIDPRSNDSFNGSNSFSPNQPSLSINTSTLSGILTGIDQVLIINNPFLNINATSVSIAGATFVDPFAWLGSFGTNLFYDGRSIIIRSLIIIIGLIIVWKACGNIIKIDIGGNKNAMDRLSAD